MSSGGQYGGSYASGVAGGVNDVAQQIPQAIQALTNKAKTNAQNLLSAQESDQNEYNALMSQDVSGLDETGLAARQQKLIGLGNRMTGRKTQFQGLQKNPFFSQLTQGMDADTLFTPKYTVEQDTARLSTLKNQYQASLTSRTDLEQQLQTALSNKETPPQQIVILKTKLAELDAQGKQYAGKLALPWQDHANIYADVDPVTMRLASQQLGFGQVVDSASLSLNATPEGQALFKDLQAKKIAGTLTADDISKVAQLGDTNALAGQVRDLYTQGKYNQARNLLELVKNKVVGAQGDLPGFLAQHQLDKLDKDFADPKSQASTQANELDAQPGVQNDATRASTAYTGQLGTQLQQTMKYRTLDEVSQAAEKGDIEDLAIYGQDAVNSHVLSQDDLTRLTARASVVRSRGDVLAEHDADVAALDSAGKVEDAVTNGNFHLISPEEREKMVARYGESWVQDAETRSQSNFENVQDAAVASRNFTMYQAKTALWSSKLAEAKTPGDIANLPVLQKGEAFDVMSRYSLEGGNLSDPKILDWAHKNGVNLDGMRGLQNIDSQTRKLALDSAKWTIFDKYIQNPELGYKNPGAIKDWAKKLGLNPEKTVSYFKDLSDKDASERKALIAQYRASPELTRIQIQQGIANVISTRQGTRIAGQQEGRAEQMFPTQLAQGQASLDATRVSTRNAQQDETRQEGLYPGQIIAQQDQHNASVVGQANTRANTDATRQNITQSAESFPTDLEYKKAQTRLAVLSAQYKPLEFQLSVQQLQASVQSQDKNTLAAITQNLSTQRATVAAQVNQAQSDLTTLQQGIVGFKSAAIKPYKLDKNGNKVVADASDPDIKGYTVDPRLVDPQDATYSNYQQVAQSRTMLMNLQTDLSTVGQQQADVNGHLNTLLTGQGLGPGTEFYDGVFGNYHYKAGYSQFSSAAVGASRQGMTRVSGETPAVTAFADAIYNAEGRTAAINRQGLATPYGLIKECVGCSEAQGRAVVVDKIQRWAVQWSSNTGLFAGKNPNKTPAFTATGQLNPQFMTAFGLKYSPPSADTKNQYWISNVGGYVSGYGRLQGEPAGNSPVVTPTGPKTGQQSQTATPVGGSLSKPVTGAASGLPGRDQIITTAPKALVQKVTGNPANAPFWTSASNGSYYAFSPAYFNQQVRGLLTTIKTTSTTAMTEGNIAALITQHLKFEGFGGSLLDLGNVRSLVHTFNTADKGKK